MIISIDASVYFSVVLFSIIYFPIEIFLVFLCYLIKLYQYRNDLSIDRVQTDKDSRIPVRDDKNYTCSICLEDINTKNNYSISQCNHHFHTKCLTTWLRKNDNCPICRFKLVETIDDKDKDIYYTDYIDPLDRMLDQNIN